MTLEQIRAAHRARPFKPITIRTGDGREHRVGHPELLAIMPPGRTIIVANENAAEFIDLLLVTSLHFDEDGRAPRRRRRA
jgi:hypothetical protein